MVLNYNIIKTDIVSQKKVQQNQFGMKERSIDHHDRQA